MKRLILFNIGIDQFVWLFFGTLCTGKIQTIFYNHSGILCLIICFRFVSKNFSTMEFIATTFPESSGLSSFKSSINKVDLVSLSTPFSLSLVFPLSELCYKP